MQIHIWQLRTEKKLTLRQLGELSGVSSSEINVIENGKVSPRLDTLELLAKGLDISIHELFSV